MDSLNETLERLAKEANDKMDMVEKLEGTIRMTKEAFPFAGYTIKYLEEELKKLKSEIGQD